MRAVPFLVIAGYLWVLWVSTGFFPANVQSYEQTPTLIPLLYNAATKALVSTGLLKGLVA